MDAIVFIILTLVLVLSPDKSTSNVTAGDDGESTFIKEDIARTAKLNDSYYKDENAFSEMINELGFPKG